MIKKRDIMFIITAIFLQYIVLNVFPHPFTGIDVFLILAGLYILKAEARRSILFVFVSGIISEIIYPVSPIIGIKTIASLTLGYALMTVARKMVIKGAVICLFIGLFAILVVFSTVVLNKTLGIMTDAPLMDYVVFFVSTILASCLVSEKIHVLQDL